MPTGESQDWLRRAALGDPVARQSLRQPLGRVKAEAVQIALASRVRVGGVALTRVRAVAGAACVSTGDDLFAAAVVLAFPRPEVLDQANAYAAAVMPYVPGLRAFREGAALVAAIENLKVRPDVIFFSGHGIAHPRRCGVASHLGLALGIASIGCARRPLGARVALCAGEPGDCAPLTDNAGNQVGAAVTTRAGSAPLLVSVGHLIDLGTAVALTLACCRGQVLPEPLRRAVAAARQGWRGGPRNNC